MNEEELLLILNERLKYYAWKKSKAKKRYLTTKKLRYKERYIRLSAKMELLGVLITRFNDDILIKNEGGE